jgi:hypothetical protein
MACELAFRTSVLVGVGRHWAFDGPATAQTAQERFEIKTARTGRSRRGLEHHLWVFAGLGDLGRQHHRVVVDAGLAEAFTGLAIRTITERRRCRSIPTICRPSYPACMVGPPSP